MGINASCPCTNTLNSSDNEETTDSSTHNASSGFSSKHYQFPKSEIVLTQTATSQSKQTKICIIPSSMIELCFKSNDILAIDKFEGLFYERAVICNYLSSLSFAIVIFQSQKGKEDIAKNYFKRQREYVNTYHMTLISFTEDSTPLIKEKLLVEMSAMLNKDFFLIGICLNDTDYQLLFKQRAMSIGGDYCYRIEVFETNNKVINKEEIEGVIAKNKGRILICFFQYCFKQAYKSAFFFIFNESKQNCSDDGHLFIETKVGELIREQIPSEKFIMNLAEKINQVDVLSAFGSTDNVYYTY